MTDRLYLRHSTDHQTDARQCHALSKLIAAGAPVYDDPATSTRVLALDRPGFKRLLDEAAVGDTIRIADAARLFRSVADVLSLRSVLIRRGLHLRVESGLLSGIDLASDDPGTKMVVSVLATVLEFQRDMISEHMKEGVVAAEAAGKTLGRPPSWTARRRPTSSPRTAKTLAREYRTSPKTIRRVLDAAGVRDVPSDLDALAKPAGPSDDSAPAGEEAATSLVSIDVPSLLADFLQNSVDPDIRRVLRAGRTIRRGQGYSLRVTAPLGVHRAVLELCADLTHEGASPAARKAHRIYSNRIITAAPAYTAPF